MRVVCSGASGKRKKGSYLLREPLISAPHYRGFTILIWEDSR